jgi:hypothetical protein
MYLDIVPVGKHIKLQTISVSLFEVDSHVKNCHLGHYYYYVVYYY